MKFSGQEFKLWGEAILSLFIRARVWQTLNAPQLSVTLLSVFIGHLQSLRGIKNHKTTSLQIMFAYYLLIIQCDSGSSGH